MKVAYTNGLLDKQGGSGHQLAVNIYLNVVKKGL